ncbi:tail fiber assembly protein [Citrobacter freundii]|uniref:Tail fiber assembly protein n=2 Tax=Enterobacteriaceae TaxID=543 RepID=A0ABY7KTZ7_CITFR|nr:tail fiber assembly protein [Citrobacter freundii]EIJ9084086.1 tail fiber assembly protein [Citrobacter freundii]EJH9545036.1 tail fiber assembly protein [Citrobacter freundii]EJO6484719.1 tail fiber assembly protein [Citrobacter freundii]EKW5683564.1 tail fiber assembly protein [Citrobacter freundii]EKX9688885.1 tail fiber assembly protein [Citrobacter freundii]
MQFFKRFTRYHPVEGEQAELAEKHNVMFLRAEDGTDWYEAQKKFATDTMKLVIDDEGIIRSFSRDITTLWPVDKSVAEVAFTTSFDDVWIDGGWQYRDGKVSPRVYTQAELVEQAERKKSSLLAEAMAAIAPLERAVKLDIATSDEIASLEVWERYSVMVNRVDTSKPEWPTPPDTSKPLEIVWPEVPDNVA